MRGLLLAALLSFVPGLALANGFEPIKDKDTFLSLVKDRELRIGIYNLTLKVLPDGKIQGRALGWDISGNWKWEDGYFCRDMDWSGYAIPFNCQLVEARGERELRFTVDRGKGNSASFRLR
ncbi:MAG: dihydrodipicolinate reductase [Cypionkella sp.]|jgi:hypothetical protein|nr:dihydrodipicolinate reductase [Cypionkella sp.]